ncbi:MAG: histidine phosphatase family protein [Tissierellaceae bacterium]
MNSEIKGFISIFLVLSFIMFFGIHAFAQGYEGKEGVSSKEGQGKEVVLYVTRHGKTILNTTDRVQGWIDSPLTEAGVEVAEYLGKGLRGIPFVAAYSSDSGRAVETAEIALEQSNQTGLEIIKTKNLREIYFGKYEGELNHKMVADIAEEYKLPRDTDQLKVFNRKFSELVDTIAKLDETKQAEDWEQVGTRIKSELDNISKTVAEKGGGNVLIVAHGLTINGILSTIQPDYLTGYLDNASITKIIYRDGKYTIESINDMGYVERGKNK